MTPKHGPKERSIGAYQKILARQKAAVLEGMCAQAQSLVKSDRISDEDQAQYSVVSLRLNGFEFTRLRQIQEALDRLAFGEFGVCLACAGPIAEKRLRALPWARYCVECQQRRADDAAATSP